MTLTEDEETKIKKILEIESARESYQKELSTYQVDFNTAVENLRKTFDLTTLNSKKADFDTKVAELKVLLED